MKRSVDAPEQNGADNKRQQTSEVGLLEVFANESLFSRIYANAKRVFFGLFGTGSSPEPLSAEEIAIRNWVSHARTKTLGNETALHIAVRENQLDAVCWLLQNGDLQEKDINAKDDRNFTPLRIAVSKEPLSILEYFLALPLGKRPDLNLRDSTGSTVLLHAAVRGHLSAIERFLALPVSERPLLDARNIIDRTPLHYAVVRGHLNVIERFLALPTDERPDVKARDNIGQTPLHLAANGGHLNITERLLALPVGERPDINAIDQNGYTPIMLAFEQGYPEIVAFLQGHGAVLPEHFRAGVGGVAVNNTQSIHTASNHESVSDSATKLLARYNKADLASAQAALFAWVLSLAGDDVKTQAAKRTIVTFGNSDYVDPRSCVTFKQAFGLVWLGVNDKHAVTDLTLTEDDINIRRQTLIEHLYLMQRGYNLNATWEDHGFVDKPICASGGFSTFINTLAGGHQDVAFIYITPKTINLKAEAILKETLEKLTPEKKAEYANKTQQEEDLLPKLLKLIVSTIKEKLNDEFLGSKGLPPNYAELVETFCVNLEFHPGIQALTETLQELCAGSTEKTVLQEEARALTFSSEAAASPLPLLPAISDTFQTGEKTRKRAH